MPIEKSPLRIAIFTHDNYGMGHLQRSLRIMQAIHEQSSNAAVLLVTGSPMLDLLKRLPPNADYVKIPTQGKPGLGPVPFQLPIGQADTTLIRERLIRETLADFSPDILLVDNFAMGSQRELLPSLHDTRLRHTRTVLGLRDVIDVPRKVRGDWRRQGIYEVLDRYYDSIVVYGVPEIFDTASVYSLPPSVTERVHYFGFVTDIAPPSRPGESIRAELGIERPYILAAVGGGGDGYPLLRTLLDAKPLLDGVSLVIIAGALMNNEDRAELQNLSARQSQVVMLDYVEDPTSYMASADAFVSMCGYNTAAEIMAIGCRAVVVPRTWRSGEHLTGRVEQSESEQLLRAQALADAGIVDLLEPYQLSPENLAEKIRAALDRPKPERSYSAELQGAGRTAAHLISEARSARRDERV